MATGGRRRGRVLIFVALILILLVVLAWAVMRFITPSQPANVVQTTPVPAVTDTVNIVISTQKISRGADLTEAVLTTVPYPRKDLVEGSFITDLTLVKGKRARFDIDARIPLTQAMLVDSSVKNSPAAFQIPKGLVAIPIPVSKLSSVAYGLQTGDHVNVIVSLLMVDIDAGFQSKLPNNTGLVIAPGPTAAGGPSAASATITKGDGIAGRVELDPTLGQAVYVIPSESQRPRLVSQTLIQDAIVLQVGNFSITPAVDQTQPTPVPQPNQQTQQTTAPVVPDTVTLIVTPQDAVTLNYLMLAGGKLNLVMRAAGDDQQVATEAVTLQFILDQYRIPNPAKLPYGLEPRMDKIPSVIESFPTSGSTTVTAPPQ